MNASAMASASSIVSSPQANSSLVIHSGGEIINVGMPIQQTDERMYCFRLSACDTEKIKKALEKKGFEVKSATS